MRASILRDVGGTTPSIARLDRIDDDSIGGLVDVLVDCVDGGAGVHFLQPLSREKAEAFWRTVGAGVEAGTHAVLVAEDETGIVGTVQLLLATPENQPHRADLAKMLVHRRARRRGVGAALLEAAERLAREEGRTLLVLDTETGGDAERLYARLGWQRVGEIPDYALDPDGRLVTTTVFYKRL